MINHACTLTRLHASHTWAYTALALTENSTDYYSYPFNCFSAIKLTHFVTKGPHDQKLSLHDFVCVCAAAPNNEVPDNGFRPGLQRRSHSEVPNNSFGLGLQQRSHSEVPDNGFGPGLQRRSHSESQTTVSGRNSNGGPTMKSQTTVSGRDSNGGPTVNPRQRFRAGTPTAVPARATKKACADINQYLVFFPPAIVSYLKHTHCLPVCVRACLCVYVCGVDLNEHGDPTVDTHPADALGSYNCV